MEEIYPALAMVVITWTIGAVLALTGVWPRDLTEEQKKKLEEEGYEDQDPWGSS